MKELFDKFFGPRTASKDAAKKRLKFLLIHDQVDLTPVQIDAMKDEIIAVIARYVEIDPERMQFQLERSDKEIALVSSVPVRRTFV